MNNAGGEVSQQGPNQESDIDMKPDVAERLLDSEMFQRSLDSNFMPLRIAAIGAVTVYAFARAIHHPEELEGL